MNMDALNKLQSNENILNFLQKKGRQAEADTYLLEMQSNDIDKKIETTTNEKDLDKLYQEQTEFLIKIARLNGVQDAYSELLDFLLKDIE